MLRSTLLALAIIAPATAYAGQCPMMMKDIDAALETTTITEQDKARVAELRQQGEQQHGAGDHAASEQSLAEAKKILGI
jgi:hypothetical protein